MLFKCPICITALTFLLTVSLIGITAPALAEPEQAQEENITKPKRSCFGLIWCREEKDDTVSTDAFLYLYSSERSSASSKLAIRPFYLQEINPEENHIRRSILWPLGTYEKKNDYLWFHVFPFYWHNAEPNRKFTLVPPLYLNYLKDDRSYRHFFPFYGHHSQGQDYDRYFIFGPLWIATRDAKKDLRQLDIVYPLFHRSRYNDAGNAWIFPFYLSGFNIQKAMSFQYIMPLYGKWESAALNHKFLIPFYGSEQLKEKNERRFSLFGLPPISATRPLPTLSLYEHQTSQDLKSDRFFPVYSYSQWFGDESKLNILLLYNHNRTAKFPRQVTDYLFPVYWHNNDLEYGNSQFSLLGYNKASLFWNDSDKELTENHLFPVYSYTNDRGSKEFQLSLIGYGDFAAYSHQRTSSNVSDRIFPLYDYNAEEAWQSFSFLGLSELSLFKYDKAPDSIYHRFFPLYGYKNYPSLNEKEFGILGYLPVTLYYDQKTPNSTANRLFPLYGYRRLENETSFSLLGLPPTSLPITLALFEHTATPDETKDRLFPVYHRYKNRLTGELRWDSLFIYQHRQTPSYFKNAFLPVHHYENNIERGTRHLSLLGIPPFTIFNHYQTPGETGGYLFPLHWHGYEKETGKREFGLVGIKYLSLYKHQKSLYSVSDYLFPFYGYKKDDLEKRFSAMGFPPIGPFPAAAIYEHHIARNRMTNRFFPLYWVNRNKLPDTFNLNILLAYNHTTSEEQLSDSLLPLYSFQKGNAYKAFSMFGFQEFSLYEYVTTPTATKNRLFPFYHYSHINAEKSLAVIGHSEISLYKHTSNPASTHDRLFPLYSYRYGREGKETSFTLLGFPPIGKFPTLALYKHTANPKLTYDRFFPFYRYIANHDKQETKFGALLIFQQLNNPALKRNSFFPLYSYEKNINDEEKRFGLIGIAPVSLYQHLKQKNNTFDRFFPIYNFSSDMTENKANLSVMWPLFSLKSANGKITETSMLWWLIKYTRPDAKHKSLRVLGGSAMAVLRRDVTPERSMFEFNPVIPFYSYQKEAGKETKWDLLGGLFGIRTEGKTREVKIFWVKNNTTAKR